MFELMPYDRRRHAAMYDPWKAMEDFEKSVFGGDMVTAFKTDIKETRLCLRRICPALTKRILSWS